MILPYFAITKSLIDVHNNRNWGTIGGVRSKKSKNVKNTFKFMGVAALKKCVHIVPAIAQ
jgi:hypothetical protein